MFDDEVNLFYTPDVSVGWGSTRHRPLSDIMVAMTADRGVDLRMMGRRRSALESGEYQQVHWKLLHSSWPLGARGTRV